MVSSSEPSAASKHQLFIRIPDKYLMISVSEVSVYVRVLPEGDNIFLI